jgi:FtsP/CotA-like multicopper oxidase with cupredoxin domain
MAPDGIARDMLVINGQFPGPAIEANWGDTIVVHVQNNLQYNGFEPCFLHAYNSTAIHWHGFHQQLNNANDGVPGVTQCTPKAHSH